MAFNGEGGGAGCGSSGRVRCRVWEGQTDFSILVLRHTSKSCPAGADPDDWTNFDDTKIPVQFEPWRTRTDRVRAAWILVLCFLHKRTDGLICLGEENLSEGQVRLTRHFAPCV